MPAMLYKFTSEAGANLIMFEAQGNELLRLLGLEPSPKGIFEAADMADHLQRIDAALALATDVAVPATRSEAVGLRQRLWPMVALMKRAQAARVPILWGV